MGAYPRTLRYDFDCLIAFLTNCELNTSYSNSWPLYCTRHCIFKIWRDTIFDHIQLYERRIKHAIGREIAFIKGLNVKFMSDEETDSEDSETFAKRTPKWSNKLNKFIEKLDGRYVHSRERKDNSKPCKARKIGQPSERPIPVSAPKLATTIELTPWSFPSPSSGSSSDPTDTPSGSNATSECASPEYTSLNQSPPLSPQSSVESDLEEDPEFDSWLAEATGVQV